MRQPQPKHGNPAEILQHIPPLRAVPPAGRLDIQADLPQRVHSLLDLDLLPSMGQPERNRTIYQDFHWRIGLAARRRIGKRIGLPVLFPAPRNIGFAEISGWFTIPT